MSDTDPDQHGPDPNAAVVISYVRTIDDDSLQPLVEALQSTGIPFQVQRREPPGPWAAIEWYIPTAAIIYLTKSYFDGFLNEAGREHYQTVKRGIRDTWTTFFGERRTVRVTVVTSSPGKAPKKRQYSLALSLMANASAGKNFKLLLDDDMTQQELEAAVEQFVRFVTEFHAGTLDQRTVDQLEAVSNMPSMFLVAYDRETARINVLDPRERRAREGA